MAEDNPVDTAEEVKWLLEYADVEGLSIGDLEKLHELAEKLADENISLKAKLSAKDGEIKAAFRAGAGFCWVRDGRVFDRPAYLPEQVEEAFTAWLVQRCQNSSQNPV